MKIPFLSAIKKIEPTHNVKVPIFNNIGVKRVNASAPLEDALLLNIARHFSVLKFEHFNTEDYKKIDNELTKLLKLRPNQKQTPQEFWEDFFYQVYTFGHGIIIPKFEKNKIKELNIVDMSVTKCFFLEDTFVFIINGTPFAIDYNDVIHLRLEARQIHNNEELDRFKNNIPNIIDENLSVMMTELKNNFDVKGVFKIGTASSLGANATAADEQKKKRAKELASRIQQGILVIDANEEWQQQSGGLLKSSVEDMNTLTDMFYKTYGITPAIANNNYTFEQYNNFYQTTLLPKLRDLEEEINYKLITPNRYKKGERLTVRIPITNGMAFKDLVTYFDKMKYHGIQNNNEIREIMGLSPVAGGDVYTGNLNMATPDGQKPKGSAPKGGDNNEDDEDVGKLPNK